MITRHDEGPILVAMGTSLGDRRQLLQRALAEVARLDGVRVLAASPVYDTAPAGGVATNRFLNAAMRLQTRLEPEELLCALLRVEATLGRTRHQRWEDRTMDLDLLLWGQRIIRTPRLVVPHPRMHQRRFVLVPAVDLAPDATHPLLRRSLAELLDELAPAQGDCRRVGSLALGPP